MATDSSNWGKRLVAPLLGVVVVATGGFYGFNAYRHNQQYETTDNAQIETSSAPVLARVAGYVQAVNVSDYASVQKGVPLLTIDPQEYQLALQQAEADYLQTEADLQTARADLQTAQANARNVAQNLNVAQASAGVQALRRDKARQDLQRDQNLFNDQSLTRRQLDDSRNNADVQERQFQTSQEQVALARTGQGVAGAAIARAQATIKKMEAVLKVKQTAIDNARLRLSYAQVSAPIAGKIGRKSVVVGQYVQPGQNLMTVIADSTFWVVANFKETQLEHMRVGQEVDIKIDAYPNLTVKGRVASLSEATGARFALLPPDNASGNFVKITQRVPVKIEILNPETYRGQLRAGLSTDVAVKVQ